VTKLVIVTGAAGFVGSAIALGLENAGYEVARITRAQWDMARPLPERVFPSRADALIHAAAITTPSDSLERVNVGASEELARFAALRGVGHVLYVSTGGVYGMKRTPCTEDDPVVPHNAYSDSKARGEAPFSGPAATFKTVVARLFFPYGPGQQGRLIPNIIDRIAAREPVELHNSAGTPRINPIFIDDVVRAFVAMIRTRSEGVINVAGPQAVTIREIASSIAAMLGVPADFRVSDEPESALIGETSRLRALLPNHAFIPVQAGLAATVAARATEVSER
jgi:nucleoside-diphosphate-sugar epimerase